MTLLASVEPWTPATAAVSSGTLYGSALSSQAAEAALENDAPDLVREISVEEVVQHALALSRLGSAMSEEEQPVAPAGLGMGILSTSFAPPATSTAVADAAPVTRVATPALFDDDSRPNSHRSWDHASQPVAAAPASESTAPASRQASSNPPSTTADDADACSKRWCNFLYATRCPFSVHHESGEMEPCKFTHLDAYARLEKRGRKRSEMPSLMSKHVRNLIKEMSRIVNTNARRCLETHSVAAAWGSGVADSVSPYLDTVTELRRLGWVLPEYPEWRPDPGMPRRLEDAPWASDVSAIIVLCTNLLHYDIASAPEVVFKTISWVLGCNSPELKCPNPDVDVMAGVGGTADPAWILGDLMQTAGDSAAADTRCGDSSNGSSQSPLEHLRLPSHSPGGHVSSDGGAGGSASATSFVGSGSSAPASSPTPAPAPALSAKKLRKQRQKAKKAEAKAARAALAAEQELMGGLAAPVGMKQPQFGAGADVSAGLAAGGLGLGLQSGFGGGMSNLTLLAQLQHLTQMSTTMQNQGFNTALNNALLANALQVLNVGCGAAGGATGGIETAAANVGPMQTMGPEALAAWAAMPAGYI